MIKPTVGRKVWYWPVGEEHIAQVDKFTPCDATVLYAFGDTGVNLMIVDHKGGQHFKHSAYLWQGAVEDRPMSSCATWMPYQAAQAKKHETDTAAS